jgi:hypothetical protein
MCHVNNAETKLMKTLFGRQMMRPTAYRVEESTLDRICAFTHIGLTMSNKNWIDNIPKQNAKPQTQNFQTNIDRILLKMVNKARREDNISWRDLTEAMFQQYLVQHKSRAK